MKNSIFYGGNAIILPYKRHRKYTESNDKTEICKVTPYNRGEMLLLPKLMDDINSKEYIIELVKSVTYDTLLEDNIPKKILEFINYLEKINHVDKPKRYTNNQSFSYCLFKSGECDLYEIHQSIFDNKKNYFTNDTEYKSKKCCLDLINGLRFLHKKEICHFDIKPENIVLDNDRFKYIDFGFAEEFPFKSYITNGPRGTLEYIPFSTNNTKIISVFTGFLPYLPCDDWSRRDESGWFHLNYGNDYKRNTSKISSSIYKVDVYALGRTINTLLELLCMYKDCTIVDKTFINKMIEPRLFMRTGILDSNLFLPHRILDLPEYEDTIDCCLFVNNNKRSLGRASKLTFLKFT